ncbi:MAG: preprotein translocase subunit SecE [Thiotrichaceae bacterium]
MATASADSQTSSFDILKLVLAIALVLVAMGGFYYYSQESLLYRVLGLLAVVGVAAGIALTTYSGKNLIGFMGNARTEVRKMVWPTRVETVQTTLVVLFMVTILAIFLLIIDSILGWAVKFFLGTGG